MPLNAKRFHLVQIQLSILTLFLFFLPSAFAASPLLVDCEVMLGTVKKPYHMQVLASRYSLAVRLPGYYDGVIAGNTHSLNMVLKGLRMSADQFRTKFAGKKVLLVGEGFGELLPALIDAGAKPLAVDPLYALRGMNDRLFRMSSLKDSPNARLVLLNFRDYLNEYDDYLWPALAQQLPFKEESFDFVISHLLISNLFSPNFIDGQTYRSQYRTIIFSVITSILESGRVLKRGGEALHVIAGKNTRPQFLGDNGILSPAYIGKQKIAKSLEFQMTTGIEVPVDFSDRMGDLDAVPNRRTTAEVSLLTVRRR
jgi:SAM-dependent methyltransferase